MMLIPDSAPLVHAIGFVTGIALYAMLASMVLRVQGSSRAATTHAGHRDHIPLATAVLGLVWNAGALLAYGAPSLVASGSRVAALEWVGALAFSALGFLPAVVVHAALQAVQDRGRTALTGAAYALSTTAALLHLVGAASGAVPSRPALLLLSGGYAVVLAILGLRMLRHSGARGPLAAAALASFAVMAIHLGHHGDARESLLAEVLGDHASIALAVVILYQDYRFALADLFLKRALSLVLLVGAALVAYLAAAPFVAPRLARDPADPRAVATLLGLWVLTALLHPPARNAVHAFVDRTILRRADYGALRTALQARLAALQSPAEVLDATCAELAPALSAGRVAWSEADHAVLPAATTWADPRHQTVVVPVHTASGPAFTLTVGELRGGRRLLSDDLALLESAGVIAARRIDALGVAHERWERATREREIQQLATEAELRALRAQLNPHFLFNALTTIGHLMQEAPERARSTLLQLTGLLRAVLTPTAGELVTVAEEMEIVAAYLAIERARFEERLRLSIDLPDAVRALRIPPLLLQPLVENAVKHGITPLREGGVVSVSGRIDVGDDGRRLHLTVSDSGAGFSPAERAARPSRGVGLASVEQRLARQFGERAGVAIRSAPGAGTSVELWLPAIETGTPRGASRGAPPTGSGHRTGDVDGGRAARDAMRSAR
jgi:two-component system LytT family sensor kinase